MVNKWILTQDGFDRLLSWLDPDREQAGKKYEEIRYKLIKIFGCRGCWTPEDLADETINRVTRRLDDIEETYTGDPARYFCGVAHKVHMEYLRKHSTAPPPEQAKEEESEEEQQQYECLEKCMLQLTTNNRELVLEYYSEEKRAKIDCRKQLAEKLGIPLNALRIRAYRIRAALQDCVQNCMAQHAT